MATVRLKPEERLTAPFDPRPYVRDVIAEYEALRAYLRERRDLVPDQLLQHARCASKAMLRLALAAARAEHAANQARTRQVDPTPAREALARELVTPAEELKVLLPVLPMPALQRRRRAGLEYLPLPGYDI